MERYVKMEVVKIFIVNFCVKGGDLFVVMVWWFNFKIILCIL